ncbi:MAG: argininosuccinate lyase [Clostridiales bacterium]|nr:argininosuccinate lyase [Clostridiales bacterium]
MKLWSGRFSAELNDIAELFNDSLPFDKAMYRQDIAGSVAHCKMLGKCKIITASEANAIVKGLEVILSDVESGKLNIDGAEDIHSFVENALVSRIGDVGKKLHTARSRNDQVATDIRLYLRDGIDETVKLLKALVTALCRRAESELDTYMPAYTHMQKAQPTTLAHYFSAYANMFLRDAERLIDCRKRVNILPLGSGACASTTFPIDREYTAKLLGFDGVCDNSLDGVSDRDFAVEYLSAAALVMTHLSRINEEFIYWSGEEFGFIKLPDEFSTGSSIMPQKKNPDVSELLRGKSGRVFGELIAMLTVIKGLPLAYNKDMQEDKEPLFDADKTVRLALTVFTAMLEKLEFDRDAMKRASVGGFSCATEIADYLAARGVPFRTAHEITGNIVKSCIANGKNLQTLSLDEYKSFSPLFEQDIHTAVTAESAVSRRTVKGGCAPQEVKRQISTLLSKLESI